MHLRAGHMLPSHALKDAPIHNIQQCLAQQYTDELSIDPFLSIVASLQKGRLKQDQMNQVVTETTPAKRWADPTEIGEVTSASQQVRLNMRTYSIVQTILTGS